MLLFVTGAIVGSLTSSALPLSVFLAGLATLLAARRMVRLLITLNRIADFENYRAKLLRRWPDIVLPE